MKKILSILPILVVAMVMLSSEAKAQNNSNVNTPINIVNASNANTPVLTSVPPPSTSGGTSAAAGGSVNTPPPSTPAPPPPAVVVSSAAVSISLTPASFPAVPSGFAAAIASPLSIPAPSIAGTGGASVGGRATTRSAF